MNILFGMCGMGSRFQKIGYDIPKYLISYHGAPMIYHAVETLNIPGKIHFIVKTEHLQKYKFLEKMLLGLGHEIITCDRDTDGAAESLMLAKPFIKNMDEPLISVNCDQYMQWDSSKFVRLMKEDSDVSYILTYKETSPKCSYVKENPNGLITEVREKQVISNDATIGVYHWARSRYFFDDAEKMIADNHRENGEYYVAPVYNYTIAKGYPVKKFEVQKTEFWPVGIPSDLEHFYAYNSGFD
jgi:dTDP-glucose pyrophosphorylase